MFTWAVGRKKKDGEGEHKVSINDSKPIVDEDLRPSSKKISWNYLPTRNESVKTQDEAFIFDFSPKITKQESGPERGQIYVQPDREVWGTRFDFLVSMLAFVMDYSTVWRFPLLCFKNGGVVFLIPYLIMMAVCAFPVFYLELIIGQFVREGVIGMWKICPLFRGVGYSVVLMSYIMTCAYNVLLTWMLLYTFGSCQSQLPWADCHNEWNTDQCIQIKETMEQSQRNGSLSGVEYFHGEVVQMKDALNNKTYSLTNIGKPITLNVIFLTVVYVILITFLLMGVIKTVKLMWICTALPLVVLSLFSYRSISVPGSRKGFSYFFSLTKNYQKLWQISTWTDAASQVFYSTGLGFGVHIALASFNPFHQNLFKNLIAVMVVNTVVSLMSLAIVFGFVGATAFVLKKEMEQMQFTGHQIIFEIFPDALARLPAYNFYSFIFFLMLFCLSFAGNLAVLQCIITSIKNMLRSVSDVYKIKSCIIVSVAVTLSYIIGCLSLTQGGFDIFTLLSDNVATTSLVFCAFLQLMGVSWFYGLDNVCKAEFAMNDRVPSLFVLICWKFVTPVILLVVTIKSLIPDADHEHEGNTKKERDIKKYVGYIIAIVPIILIFIVAITRAVDIKGPRRFLCLISPIMDHDVIRQTLTGPRATKTHWRFIGTRTQLETIIPELKMRREEKEMAAKQMKIEKHQQQQRQQENHQPMDSNIQTDENEDLEIQPDPLPPPH